MNTKKLTVMALLMVATLPLAQAAFAHDRGDGDDRGYDRPAPAWHRDADRGWDRGYQRNRDWHHDSYRYRRDRDYRAYSYNYPRRDWDDRRATVVLPTPPLLLPPVPVLLVPKLHKGHVVLRPAF